MASERASKPEAVVVGSGLNALGVVRSLAPERIAVTVVDAAPAGPAARSRFARPSLYKAAVNGADALLQHLMAYPSKDERPLLFLTQEASVSPVSAHREALKDRFRFLLAAPDVLGPLMDKKRFQQRAGDLGFPVPRSVVIERRTDVDAAAGLVFPVILKPLTKNEAWERRYQKAYRFEESAKLSAFVAGIDGTLPPMIIQEWIEGSDSDVYFTLVYRDAGGKTVASFTGRKIRQWPPQVGGTASCTAAPEFENELSEMTTRFFDAVGFVGMGSMEFKRDRRSGRFVMVEPTVGRSDYQEEVATLNGVNVVRAAYRSLAGLPPLAHQPSHLTTVWRDAMGDERSRLAQPGFNLPENVAAARRFDALFRMNDPGPWLADLAARISARLGIS